MAKWIRTLNKYECLHLSEIPGWLKHRTNRAPLLWNLQYSVDGSEPIGGLTQVDNSFGEWAKESIAWFADVLFVWQGSWKEILNRPEWSKAVCLGHWIGPTSHTWYHSQGPDVVACWVSFQITARRARRSKENWLSGRTKDGSCGNWAEKWHYLMAIWVGSRGMLSTDMGERSVLAQGQKSGRRGEKSGRLHPMALHVAEQRPGSHLEWGQRTEDRISNAGEQEGGGTREMQEEEESVWSWTLCLHEEGTSAVELSAIEVLKALGRGLCHLPPAAMVWWGSLRTSVT